MAIDGFCPSCGNSYRVPSSMAGQQVDCDDCGHSFHVPGFRPSGKVRTARVNLVPGLIVLATFVLVFIWGVYRLATPAPWMTESSRNLALIAFYGAPAAIGLLVPPTLAIGGVLSVHRWQIVARLSGGLVVVAIAATVGLFAIISREGPEMPGWSPVALMALVLCIPLGFAGMFGAMIAAVIAPKD